MRAERNVYRGVASMPENAEWDPTRILGGGRGLPQQWQASGATPSFVVTANSTSPSVYAAASSLLNKS